MISSWVERLSTVLFHLVMGLAEEDSLSLFSLSLRLSYTACLECTDVSFWEWASCSVHTHIHSHTLARKNEREEKGDYIRVQSNSHPNFSVVDCSF